MASIKALADTNIEISKAKNLLFKLQESETDYLVIREKKAMDRIQKVVDDSKELVKEATNNHSDINNLLIEATALVTGLDKVSETYTNLLIEFDERNVEWERHIGKQQDNLEEIRKGLKAERVQIDNDKKSIEQTKISLANAQRKIDSDRGTIQRSIERLRQGKI